MRWIITIAGIFALTGTASGQVADAQGRASQAISDGEYTKALGELAVALEEEPENAYSHYLAALAYLDSRSRADKAEHHLTKAEEYGAQAQPVAFLRARINARQGNHEAALAIIESLAEGGYAQLSRLQQQEDFDPIRGEARFEDALAKVRAARYPCQADSRHADFDFWVGDWNVYQNGTFAGENAISSILGGCLVFEEWQSASGSRGKSFNYFDPGRNHWRQIWVADTGTIIEFTGEARDGGIFYTAETTDPASGAVTHHRFEFTPQPGGEVRQFWATSSDKSEWTTIWDGIYKRKEN